MNAEKTDTKVVAPTNPNNRKQTMQWPNQNS